MRAAWFRAAITMLAAMVNTAAFAETVVLRGSDAFGDWRLDKPGLRRLIRAEDLPAPGPSAANGPRIAARPSGVMPQVPPGFRIDLFAEGLKGPRILRVAPNGDVFVAETYAGRVRVLRAPDGAARPAANSVYASGLKGPFGIAFFPTGAHPRWVYVANTDSVVRFPYKDGDLVASGAPETIVADLPHGGGHWTRDIAFMSDNKRMLVSVGSASNAAEGQDKPPGGIKPWSSQHALGADWGIETDRADVLAFDPKGKARAVFATGIRNCAGLAVQPGSGAVWCSTNERDGLGDNLVPDYVTRVREGAFYGWPWFYIGDHQDPRHPGARADLRGKITVPDVLLQSHSAPLELAFYDRDAFPPEYRGDAFVAAHGSWNRAKRTGYKVVRILMKDGVPTGEYEDFVTGFVIDDAQVWGRPVGVAVAHDGALLVSDDASGTIWRITH